MTVNALDQSLDFNKLDIYGNSLQLNNFKGKKILLSFFRDATCPFCHFRLYELTNQHKNWKDQNLEIVAVFTSNDQSILRHVARSPRPFHMIGDPDLSIYQTYGVKKSFSGLLKGMMFKVATTLKGYIRGGTIMSMFKPHITIIPADFLINEQGVIEQVWYGDDPSDHIPMTDINEFIKN